VILSADAADSSLAHELGHFFGIQPHSSVKNNLMSYDREDALVFLDAAQQAIVKSTANTLRMSGALAILGWQ
jgi:predicted Zn-dependent protease